MNLQKVEQELPPHELPTHEPKLCRATGAKPQNKVCPGRENTPSL
jgi:hypothetical protein